MMALAPRTRHPLHLPLRVLPQSASCSKRSNTGDPTFQPNPFPCLNLPSDLTPHPYITIEAIRTAHIPSLSRITGLLLPIRYPSSFYTACVTDPVVASLSRVAVYHGHPIAGALESGSRADVGTDKVIGSIRCRLELLPQSVGSGGMTEPQRHPTNLYIQTLLLLSPYRGNGVATSLLYSLLFSVPPTAASKSTYRVSPLVRHYNIRTVTAHVHETNEEGLRWYAARGFDIQDGIVEGYYRRLKPGGARIVRWYLQWDDEQKESTVSDITTTKITYDASKRQKVKIGEEGDDDWEQVEARDGDQDDHGVEYPTDNPDFDCDDKNRPKGK